MANLKEKQKPRTMSFAKIKAATGNEKKSQETVSLILARENTVIKKKKSNLVASRDLQLINSTAYEATKRTKKRKKITFYLVVTALIVLFFSFGLLSKHIFNKDSWIASVAEENIVDVISIVRFFERSLPTILRSISSIIIVLVIIALLRFLINLISIGGSNRRKTIVKLIGSFIKYIGAIVMAMLLLSIWGVDTTTLLASLGIIGLIIGLGAQSLISDIISGVFAIFENAYQVGDILTIEDFRGEIIDIGIRTTQLKSALGDVLVVNNSEIRKLVNMSKHRSYAICDVTIAYGENMEKVEKIINDNLELIAKKLPVITDGPHYKGVASFSERGVVLKILAKCDEKERFQLNRDLNREIKMLFDKHKIKIAVPQMEITEKK